MGSEKKEKEEQVLFRKQMAHLPAHASGLGRIDFNLHSLGWASFQSLCATVLREILGQTYKVFADGADIGRDGAFYGKWKPKNREEMKGSFVVQCKFSAKAKSSLTPSILKGEVEKVTRLARKGVAENYIILTNSSVSSAAEEEIRSLFLKIPGVNRVETWGGEWLCDEIRENKRLRALVPRIYGLGDLTEILDERAYEQAQELLSWFGEGLERFVVTDSHQKSVAALHDKGFVFLLGDPGSGKSSIAAALALAAADTWQSRVVKIEHPNDFKALSNPNETNQFFWVDDAFGQTHFEQERTLEWNRLFRRVDAAIKRGAKAIFTSRTYIYRAARKDLQESMFPLMRKAQVVIEVENLTQREREQILYNHLRLGTQPSQFRRRVKPFLSEFASHEKFLPETARRLGDPTFTERVKTARESLLKFVAEPEEYLRDIILNFSDANRAALGVIFMHGGRIPAPLNIGPDGTQSLKLMNSSIGEVSQAFRALEGSLVVQELVAGEINYRFKHPTVRDAFGSVIAEDPNMMDVYLKGVRIEILVNEITCGDVGLEGVKLIVPSSRFPAVAERLSELKSRKDKRLLLVSFLASRCTAEFLRLVLDCMPDFLSTVHANSWGIYSRSVRLFSVLHHHKLLPESERKRFIHELETRVLHQPEWRVMKNEQIQSVFRKSELRALRAKVRREVTARKLKTDNKIWEKHWAKEKNQDPSSYFLEWELELIAFQQEFSHNQAVSKRFHNAHDRLQKIKEKLKQDWDEKEKIGEIDAASESESFTTRRSIFDDVDA